MAVLPESMNRLNLNDTPGSLSTIEKYIHYMVERVEFAMTNTGRNVSEAGTSNVNVLLAVQEANNALSRLSSVLNNLTGEVTSANARMTKMQESIETIQGEVTALVAQVADLEGNGG